MTIWIADMQRDARASRARKVKQRPRIRGVHTGVPTFFRALCYDTANGGGENGYGAVGWFLAAALGSEIPDDIDGLADWQPEVDKLEHLVRANDEVGVWTWFKMHYPKCMALVPTRRRSQFVAGVQGAWYDGSAGL